VRRIGLALGGGGAKGLAHIRILETLDELGARPAAIAGTSIGAIVGALYASGLSGRELREELDSQLFAQAEEGSRRVFDLSKGFRRVLDLIDLDFGSGGFIRGEKFMQALYEDVRAHTFEELEIPLKVVATEFWSREQVVFESGELDRVLMDGGAVNPLPYDLLPDDCDITIAIDVSGARSKDPEDQIPSLSESIFNTFQIMSKAIVDQKLRQCPPDIYLRPDLVDVQVLEFDKMHEIFEQAEPACEALRERIAPLLASA
jgi:NTE family protein